MSVGRAPNVCIGMPVYNGAAYIREALDSVLAQTYQNFELIISDNASTDNTGEICLDYSKRDKRIKYIRQAKNLGGPWNFRFVAHQSRASLFTFLAHDDRLSPDFIEESVDYFSQHPKVVLVASDFNIIDQVGTYLSTEKLETIRDSIDWSTRCAEFFKYPISNVYLCIYGMMLSATCKSIFLSLTQEPKIMSGGELPILARFAAAGEIASIPLALRDYRKHPNSMYMIEHSELSKRSIVYIEVTRTRNLYLLRHDQWRTLLSSEMAPRLKLSIGVRVLVSYVTSFIDRLSRLLVKALGLLR